MRDILVAVYTPPSTGANAVYDIISSAAFV